MSLLVFGKTGQVATELRALRPDAEFLGRDLADLSDPEACAAAITARQPKAVINAAAWTAVDAAEEHEAQARIINGEAPTAMAQACAALDVPFVQISTDYVFPGGGETPWTPEDPVDPINAYGRTKRAGELGVSDAGGRFAILRTSWVFSAHGANFVKTMLRLSETRDELSVVDDQIGGPTSARSIAATCLTMVEALKTRSEVSGIYHFSGTEDTSWAGFARAIFQMSGRKVTVTAIPTADFPTPAARPLNSRLDCSGTREVFGLPRPDWRGDLSDVLQELEVSA
ncbi:dTDP-4-dehydrorhamnose reductase [Pseudooceanicola sp. MF1-13]|uniref:dTDP-4-dehydrorhamnose reductase n=1 Tax=Pseudooceanicola sp. MF1-13 TaxID=3379095 RepID=UPI003892381D